MGKVAEVAEQPEVRATLAGFRQNVSQLVDLAVEIQQIPSPTFEEAARADYLASKFQEIGLKRVAQDALKNVYGYFGGAGIGDPLIISAHTDTVFDADTDLTVKRNGDRVSGPGIADNSLGVAGLLTVAQTLRQLDVEPEREVWFVGNVGEEGLGDLCGMRTVVDHFNRRGRYIVLEGGLFGYLCHEGIGVRRFRIGVEGPGGHSWGAFGTPSAIHVLGKLIAKLVELEVPDDPKTTYNVGVIEGGTTINSIAREASLLLDLRSEEPDMLETMVGRVSEIVEELPRPEEVSIRVETIGNRPAGRIRRRTPLVRWAEEALKQVGCDEPEYTMASTDANIPLSFGLPAVCIGLSRSGNTHRPDEYMEVSTIPAGVGQAMLLSLVAAGHG